MYVWRQNNQSCVSGWKHVSHSFHFSHWCFFIWIIILSFIPKILQRLFRQTTRRPELLNYIDRHLLLDDHHHLLICYLAHRPPWPALQPRLLLITDWLHQSHQQVETKMFITISIISCYRSICKSDLLRMCMCVCTGTGQRRVQTETRRRSLLPSSPL